ncbi:hypothetical protein XENTR_v10015686 [Xenopus tropicalis]|nr:hypothetical protein XENTR_v10015686 [Xenopus tropicalis]
MGGAAGLGPLFLTQRGHRIVGCLGEWEELQAWGPYSSHRGAIGLWGAWGNGRSCRLGALIPHTEGP